MTTNDEEKKIGAYDFPICPYCGSTERIAGSVLAKQIEKGVMPKASVAYMFKHQSIIAKDVNWFSAPMISTFYDVCGKCGATWCIHAEILTAMQGATPQPKYGQSGQGFSPS